VGYLLFDKKLLKVVSSIKVFGLKTLTRQIEECGSIKRLKRVYSFKDLKVNLSVDKVPRVTSAEIILLLSHTTLYF